MWIFLAGDAMSFGGLICAYAALRMSDPSWPIPSEHLGIPLTAFMTFLLICSSVTMVKGLEAIQHGDQAGLRKFLGLTVLGGTMFLAMQAYEWTHLIGGGEGHGLGLGTLFGATFFILTGFHGCHVFSGVVYLTITLLNAGHYTKDDHNAVEIAGLYWHFVDLVWILIFTFVYLV
jgi:heme/copper-type cytochrome/quinol oxidase subunit 3